MVQFINLPRVKYPDNALLNLRPLADAVDDYRRRAKEGEERHFLLKLRDEQNARKAEQQALNKNIGGLLATGNREGARRLAYEAGEIDTGNSLAPPTLPQQTTAIRNFQFAQNNPKFADFYGGERQSKRRTGKDFTGTLRYVDTGKKVFDNVPQGPAPLTFGEKSADRAFAKEYAIFYALGGFSDTEKQLKQLDQAVAALTAKKGPNVSGPIVGRVPDFISAVTNPKAIEIREKIEEVVQRNLRVILGAQFTQKEGDRLIARAYNPALSEAENAERVTRLSTQIRTAAKQKRAAVNYFSKHGTLRGFKGSLPTFDSFLPAKKIKKDKKSDAPGETVTIDSLLDKYEE